MLTAVFLLAALAPAPPQTLRLDYFHTGSATEERFALEVSSWKGPGRGRPTR